MLVAKRFLRLFFFFWFGLKIFGRELIFWNAHGDTTNQTLSPDIEIRYFEFISTSFSTNKKKHTFEVNDILTQHIELEYWIRISTNERTKKNIITKILFCAVLCSYWFYFYLSLLFMHLQVNIDKVKRESEQIHRWEDVFAHWALAVIDTNNFFHFWEYKWKSPWVHSIWRWFLR